MMFQAIVEPVVLALESDKHSSRFAMAGDENLPGLCRLLLTRLNSFRKCRSKASRTSARW
jgi:hypothetical protein